MNKELIERLAEGTGDASIDTRGRVTYSFDGYGLQRFLAAVDAERGKEAVAWIDSEQPSRVITTPYKPEENDSGWLPLFLAPQPQEPEGMAWQPIETAPKDGTRILIRGWGSVGVAGFQEGAWYFMNDCHVGEHKPTQWIPVPNPPITAIAVYEKGT